MTINAISPEALEIVGSKALDPIHVYLVDVAPGKGHVTITCYGAAWTAYFGAMGERSVREFVAAVDSGYLANKMGIAPHLKGRKSDFAYLGRIIDAVRAACAEKRMEENDERIAQKFSAM